MSTLKDLDYDEEESEENCDDISETTSMNQMLTEGERILREEEKKKKKKQRKLEKKMEKARIEQEEKDRIEKKKKKKDKKKLRKSQEENDRKKSTNLFDMIDVNSIKAAAEARSNHTSGNSSSTSKSSSKIREVMISFEDGRQSLFDPEKIEALSFHCDEETQQFKFLMINNGEGPSYKQKFWLFLDTSELSAYLQKIFKSALKKYCYDLKVRIDLGEQKI